MALANTADYTSTQNELAKLARALSHPGRVAILQHLLTVDGCIGGDIVEEIPLAQPTISRHLKELKAVGLIQGHVSGNRVNYCINPARWQQARDLFVSLFDHTVSDVDCC